MSVVRNTPKLDGLFAWAKGIGGTWRVEVQAPPDAQDKLAWLKQGGRDFLKVTPELRDAVVQFVAADVHRTLTAAGNLRTEATLREAGKAIKSVVLGRFERQGGDVRLEALDPRYRAWKAAHGRDTRIGIATRALLNALRVATFTLRKRG